MQESITNYREEIDKIIISSPSYIRIPLNKFDLRSYVDDPLSEKYIKSKIKFLKLLSSNKESEHLLAYQKILVKTG